jgi:hypothetical protein
MSTPLVSTMGSGWAEHPDRPPRTSNPITALLADCFICLALCSSFVDVTRDPVAMAFDPPGLLGFPGRLRYKCLRY